MVFGGGFVVILWVRLWFLEAYFRGLKIRHGFEIYFLGGKRTKAKAII